METIELLKKMISIPSFSGNEERVADLMVATWVEHGYSAERSGNNVWVKSRNFDPVKPTFFWWNFIFRTCHFCIKILL